MKLLLINCAIIFTLFACRYNNDDPLCKHKKIIRIPQKVLDYFYFKEGTYWVYKNETTNEIDSQCVCSSYLGTHDPTVLQEQCYCFHKQCFTNAQVLIANKDNIACNDGSGAFGLIALNYLPYAEQKDDQNYKVKTTSKLNGGNTFWKYQFKETWSGKNGLKMNLIDTTNFAINGNLFTEGIHKYYPDGNYQFDYYQDEYMAKNVGLVRYKDLNGEWWSVLRYKIIQ